VKLSTGNVANSGSDQHGAGSTVDELWMCGCMEEIKGSVQRKLRWVENGLNPWV
jgi:hypothetical protein